MTTPGTDSTQPVSAPSTARRSIALVFFCTLLGAAAQILFKRGAAHFSALDPMAAATNVPLIVGLVLYGGFTLLMVMALREGELSMLYPIISLTYVWVTLLSYTLLGEKPNLFKNIGIAVIVIGVAVLGRGGRK